MISMDTVVNKMFSSMAVRISNLFLLMNTTGNLFEYSNIPTLRLRERIFPVILSRNAPTKVLTGCVVSLSVHVIMLVLLQELSV